MGYDYTMDGLKIEQLNEGIVNFDVIYMMTTINIISLIISVLSIKKLVDMSRKIQALENVTIEINVIIDW